MAHSPFFLLKIILDQKLNKSRLIILSRGIVSVSRLAVGLPALGLSKKALASSQPRPVGNDTSPPSTVQLLLPWQCETPNNNKKLN
jgi:hypothetical protein